MGSGLVVVADVQKFDFDLPDSCLASPRSGNSLESPQPDDSKRVCQLAFGNAKACRDIKMPRPL